MNLHPSFHTIRTSILSSKTEPMLPEIKTILTGASSSILPTPKREDIDTAMVAHNQRDGVKCNRLPHKDKKGNRWCNPTNEGHCHWCGRMGHIVSRCIHDMPQQVKDWIMGGAPNQHEDQETSNVAFVSKGNWDSYSVGSALPPHSTTPY